MVARQLVILIGKLLQRLARSRGSGGAALPGLVVETLDRGFLSATMAHLPGGVIVVSGTNGKTTTTKMIVDLLAAAGATPLSNRTGSNYTRGVVSAALEVVDHTGRLPHDIAVLELDEAHAMKFIAQVRPRVSVLLNVSRDQLDRFGELDHTATLLTAVADSTTGTVVLNRDDPLVRDIAARTTTPAGITYFGVHRDVIDRVPGDDMLHRAADRERCSEDVPARTDVEVLSLPGPRRAELRVGDREHPASLSFGGAYDFANAAAALAAVRAVRPDIDTGACLRALARVGPARGRGESLSVGGAPVEFLLVKNPVGFRLALLRDGRQDERVATMIAVNDRYADGCDVSWLWDVDFTSLRGTGVACVSGTRASDVALRLQYDDVRVDRVGDDLTDDLVQFLERHSGTPMRVYATYTAMTRLRRSVDEYLEGHGRGTRGTSSADRAPVPDRDEHLR